MGWKKTKQAAEEERRTSTNQRRSQRTSPTGLIAAVLEAEMGKDSWAALGPRHGSGLPGVKTAELLQTHSQSLNLQNSWTPVWLESSGHPISTANPSDGVEH